jgi:hypothetical protein
MVSCGSGKKISEQNTRVAIPISTIPVLDWVGVLSNRSSEFIVAGRTAKKKRSIDNAESTNGSHRVPPMKIGPFWPRKNG